MNYYYFALLIPIENMENIEDFLNETLNGLNTEKILEYLKEDKYLDQIIDFYEKNKDNKIASHYLHIIYSTYGLKIFNCEKSLEYLMLSAQQNFAPSLYILGYEYSQKYTFYGVEHNVNKALHYLKLCYEQNYDSVLNDRALYNIGFIYKWEENFKNCEESMKYFELCENNSYALFEIGDTYENGIGVKQDYKKAFEYYKKSIEIKCYNKSFHELNSCSLYALGQLYENGYGTDINIDEALKCYKLAIANDPYQNDSCSNYSDYKNAYDRLLDLNKEEIFDNYLKLKEENKKLLDEIDSLRSLPGSELYKKSMEEFYENANI